MKTISMYCKSNGIELNQIEKELNQNKSKSLYTRRPDQKPNVLFEDINVEDHNQNPENNLNENLVVNDNPNPENNFEQLKKIMLSSPFIIIYLITLIKTTSNFYFSAEIKTLGMFYVNDDYFLTNIISVGIFFSFFTRLAIGMIYNYMGMRLTYFINILFEMLCSVFLFFSGHSKTGFLIFVLCSRISSGKNKIYLILRNGIHFELCNLY